MAESNHEQVEKDVKTKLENIIMCDQYTLYLCTKNFINDENMFGLVTAIN